MSQDASIFELQVYTDRGWSPLRNFNRREDAVALAKQLSHGERYKGVKVVAEIFDDARGLFVPKTIYSGSPLIDKSAIKNRKAELSIQHMVERHHDRQRLAEVERGQRRAKVRSTLFGIGLAFKLALILGSGVWVLVKLQDFV